jgi:hypothetical protein
MLEINQAVPELTGISTANVSEELLYSDTPFILRGACAHWPIVQHGLKSNKAAAEHLLKHYSGEPVNTYYGEPKIKGRVFYNNDVTAFNVSASNIPLQNVLYKLLQQVEETNPPTIYVGSTNTTRWFPTLADEHDFKIDGIEPLTSVWIGNQSRIAAHYDFPTNFACNLVGKRRFTLFPPSQIHNLYVGPIEFAPGGQEISMVDFDNPDWEKFPKFKEAVNNAMYADLEPGDVLILPSMWWHHVSGYSSFNVLLTHWWRNTSSFYGRPSNALSSAILALRSLPKEQRLAWKEIFNFYIFNEELDPLDHIPEHAKAILNTPLSEQDALKLRADLLNKLKR